MYYASLPLLLCSLSYLGAGEVASRLSPELRQHVETSADSAGLDPDFLEAVILTESDGRASISGTYRLDGPGYAHGVSQIHIPAATDAGYVPLDLQIDDQGREYSPALAQDANSILYGARYLTHRGSVMGCNGDMACMARNYNPGDPNYSDRVMSRYRDITGRDFSGNTGTGTVNSLSKNYCTFDPEQEKLEGSYIPPNPNIPWLSVWIEQRDNNGRIISSRDLKISDSSGRPQYITYFELTERLGELSEARVRVFDPNWDVVAETLLSEVPSDQANQSFGLHIFDNAVISFGYATPDADGSFPRSDGHSMFVSSYTPVFYGWGVEMEVSFSPAPFKDRVKDGRKTFSAKISNNDPDDPGVIQQIASSLGYSTCCPDSKSRRVVGEGLDSPGAAEAITTVEGEPITALVELADKHTPAGTAEENDKDSANSVMFYDSTSNTVHVHPPLLDGEPVRKYTYARQQFGSVISFRPVVLGEGVALFGGINPALGGTDSKTKKPFEAGTAAEEGGTLATQVPANPSDQAGPEDLLGEILQSDIRQPRTTSEKNENLAKIEAESYEQSARMFVNNAQLTVVGDPRIRPGRNVVVEVLTYKIKPDGSTTVYEHYTSGVWHIMQTRHVIQGGQYLTTMELIRKDILIGKKDNNQEAA